MLGLPLTLLWEIPLALGVIGALVSLLPGEDALTPSGEVRLYALVKTLSTVTLLALASLLLVSIHRHDVIGSLLRAIPG